MSLESTSEILPDQYDFIDFGCKKGGSFSYCERFLGGQNGLGIDNNVNHVNAFRAAGGNAMLGDITRLQLPPACVRFVCISHVLEHLPSFDHVRLALLGATRVARDFVYIVGPYFDADAYLAAHGLKFFWSDWKYHPTPVTTDKVAEILLSYGFQNFTCWGRQLVSDSSHSSLLPKDAPRDQHEYDPSVHSPKPEVSFDRPLYREMVFVVPLRPLPDLCEILTAIKVTDLLGPYTQVDYVFKKLNAYKKQ